MANKPRRPLERLSHAQRAATPYRFALHLWQRVTAAYGVEPVAVLWVARRTTYARLWPGVDLWGVVRDARTYDGPWPVICHPPCGPWGKYSVRCIHQSPSHGLIALDLVHRFGGVVEQPVGSRLFRDHGRGGLVERLDQGDYGHPSTKPTELYWVRPDVIGRTRHEQEVLPRAGL